jgi:putative ABC transport system ATP-binding protein
VLDLLRRLAADGQTVVIVTHDPLAAALADRVVFLRDGAIVREIPGGDADRVVEAFRTVQSASDEPPAEVAA